MVSIFEYLLGGKSSELALHGKFEYASVMTYVTSGLEAEYIACIAQLICIGEFYTVSRKPFTLQWYTIALI